MKYLIGAASALAVSFAASTAFAQGTGPQGCDDGEQVVKFAHVVAASGHPKGDAANALAERVNTEMDGTMCMEVYPNSTLYNDDQVLEAMLQGDVQLAAPSLSKFETFTKVFRIYDLPFMFVNMDAVDQFQNSDAGQEMLDSMQRRGLQGLAYWHNGLKQFSANKPLLEPGDAAGLKFRVQPSDVLVAQMEALDASPQPMAFSEVYGALQQGVVDGQENTWSNIYGQKFFEVQDGITETNHGVIDYLVVASVDWLDGLEEDTREQFLTILGEVSTERNAEAVATNEEAKQAIIDAGSEVRELDDSQRQDWVDAMKPVWEQFQEDVGTENIEAAQKINEEVSAGS